MKTKLKIILNKSESRLDRSDVSMMGASLKMDGRKYRVAEYILKNGRWVRNNPNGDGFGNDLNELKKIYPEAELGRGV